MAESKEKKEKKTKKPAAKKAEDKKETKKKMAGKKAAGKKTVKKAAKAATKKSTAKKSTAKKSEAKKTSAKKTSAKKSEKPKTAKKTSAKKSETKKTGTKKVSVQSIDKKAAEAILICTELGLTITTTESLTGGLVAARLTSIAGASETFHQGFVTYCNSAKRQMLDVKDSTLKNYGAVSRQTAKQMAENGAKLTKADVCISLTGNAGPAAEENKPVGLVYIGCCYKGTTVVKEHHFKGDREKIRMEAADAALELLIETVRRK